MNPPTHRDGRPEPGRPGKMLRSLASCVLSAALCTGTGCAQEKAPESPPGRQKQATVTFVELGSVKCVPCRMMQPVMKAIEAKYGGQISVVFHDVWTDSGKALGEPYKIRAIPTQVFLDAKGAEFHRHEGFYPEAEIDKLLQKRGLKVLSPGK